MPGSADKIVITGTSGGGGLSTAVAASGNSADYYPYLQEIGAAGIDADGNSTLTDDVFATIAYCPITDLDHADIAYEWQYGATRLLDCRLYDGHLTRKYPQTLRPIPCVSCEPRAETRGRHAAYRRDHAGRDRSAGEGWNSKRRWQRVRPYRTWAKLGIYPRDGRAVTNDWLDVDNDANTVVSIDYGKYLEFVATIAKLKTAPAFDNFGTSLQGGMNDPTSPVMRQTEYSHWLGWSWENDMISGNNVGLDDTGITFDQFVATDAGKAVVEQMQMINPMPYLLSTRRGQRAVLVCPARNARPGHVVCSRISVVLCHPERLERQGCQLRAGLHAAALRQLRRPGGVRVACGSRGASPAWQARATWERSLASKR